MPADRRWLPSGCGSPVAGRLESRTTPHRPIHHRSPAAAPSSPAVATRDEFTHSRVRSICVTGLPCGTWTHTEAVRCCESSCRTATSGSTDTGDGSPEPRQPLPVSTRQCPERRGRPLRCRAIDGNVSTLPVPVLGGYAECLSQLIKGRVEFCHGANLGSNQPAATAQQALIHLEPGDT